MSNTRRSFFGKIASLFITPKIEELATVVTPSAVTSCAVMAGVGLGAKELLTHEVRKPLSILLLKAIQEKIEECFGDITVFKKFRSLYDNDDFFEQELGISIYTATKAKEDKQKALSGRRVTKFKPKKGIKKSIKDQWKGMSAVVYLRAKSISQHPPETPYFNYIFNLLISIEVRNQKIFNKVRLLTVITILTTKFYVIRRRVIEDVKEQWRSDMIKWNNQSKTYCLKTIITGPVMQYIADQKTSKSRYKRIKDILDPNSHYYRVPSPTFNNR